VPRLRMFAGPNGSGKSRLKNYLPPPLLGFYLNPDDIEDTLRRERSIDLANFNVQTTYEEVTSFFANSSIIEGSGIAKHVKCFNSHVSFADLEINSYIAAALVDFVRRKLISKKSTFTFETVMSHRSKIEVFANAQTAGYRTYLYYIATEDPAINISRVHNRVSLGGHGVPDDRIVHRYFRSLDLLSEAIQVSNRAYIFDNSVADAEHTWIAEITDGRTFELKTSSLPRWFKKNVLDKLNVA
jgi:predicted ABC-type ATPase